MNSKNSTEAERQKGVRSEPLVTGGISSLVRAELEKINPEIRAKFAAHLGKITGNGGPPTNRNHDSDHW